MCHSVAMRPKHSPLAYLWLCAWLASCAHFSTIDAVPKAFSSRLGAHPVWITVTTFDNPPGTFPPSETSVVKKWEVKEKKGRAVLMRELFSSSLVGMLTSIHDGKEPLTEVDLRDGLDPETFFPYPGHARFASRPYKRDDYKFKDIDGKRFEILINGGVGRIVFAPAPNDYFSPKSSQKVADVGIWTTPFGAETELLLHFKKILLRDHPEIAKAEQKAGDKGEEGIYLHHDLAVARQIRVVLDKGFPSNFRPSVQKSVSKWNAAFKKTLFVLDPNPRALDPGDCLTGFEICIRWLGPPELAFTGANGYTQLSFDPQTGLILGGLISVINDDVELPLGELAAPERQRVLAGRLDWDWLASAMLRYHELNGKRHPLPDAYVEYLVLHEMGHANGFGHNFYTRGETSLDRPVGSILSYPPFPIGHRANYIAASDLQRLRMVYGHGAADAVPPGYCSSMDAMAPDQGEDGIYRKDASCDIFTVGNPVDWYIHLARQGRFGVFTEYPDLSLSDDLKRLYRDAALRRRLPPLNILTRLGFILGDGGAANAKDRDTVAAFLCASPADHLAIAAQLREFHRLDLSCPKL